MQIEMVANQRREGIQKRGGAPSGGTALGRRPGSYRKDMQSNVFEFFGRTGVTSSNIAPSPHHPLTRMSHTLEPSPQVLHSFSGPGDNYVRPPAGPQSVSRLTESKRFRLNCYYCEGER